MREECEYDIVEPLICSMDALRLFWVLEIAMSFAVIQSCELVALGYPLESRFQVIHLKYDAPEAVACITSLLFRL